MRFSLLKWFEIVIAICLFRPEIQANTRPNILLILADDLGWADVGFNGGDLVETPHLDQLAREGLKFTQAYAPSPVCSPTRAALLTGNAPARLNITIWSEGALQGPTNRLLLQAQSLHSLPHTETTIATYLQGAGYLTALVGKWHLGDAGHFPETHGFDINIGGTHWGAPTTYFWPYRGTGRFGSEYRYVPHLEFGKPGEYLTDRLTSEAIKVLSQTGTNSFFLYLAHHSPHTPIEAKAEDIKYFTKKLRPGMQHQNPTYAAMIKNLDANIGRVLEHLKLNHHDQNTIVIFTSDNGGYIGIDSRLKEKIPVTDNFPLRSGKSTCYEGGLRIPLVIRWPGITKPGSVCHEPVLLTDIFPTLLAATQIPGPRTNTCDGIDLMPLLKNPNAKLKREYLYFHYPHYYHAPPTTPVSAIRAGDWKLLRFYEDQHLELYNIREDISEKVDLAKQMPEKARELRDRLDSWLKSVKAAYPLPNPEYRSGKGSLN